MAAEAFEAWTGLARLLLEGGAQPDVCVPPAAAAGLSEGPFGPEEDTPMCSESGEVGESDSAWTPLHYLADLQVCVRGEMGGPGLASIV
jgi:hypothetical protein